MNINTTEEGRLHEERLKRLCELLWRNCENGGSYLINGKERDGIYVTEDVIHCIETTISRSDDKATHDIVKLAELRDHLKLSYTDKLIKCYFITKFDPTASQRTISNDKNITCLSFSQFQGKLFDAKNYLFCRDTHKFGSVRDPKTDNIKFEDKFIPTEIKELGRPISWNISSLANDLSEKASKFVLLGHFGVGKSLTMREVYNKLKSSYEKGRTDKFPVFLNLREHDGQRDPAEALIRHANSIGFKNPESLVSAWKLGYVTLLLDGLDELAPLSWADQPSKFKQVRYNTMSLIRSFLNDSPKNAAILISGRSNYFDSIEECLSALSNIPDLKVLKLTDFTEQQVIAYLKEKNITISLPDWFPTRPLLIAYLVSKGLFQEQIISKELDAASGWDWLIDKIVEREARLESGIEPKTIREIIERLASYCRTLKNNLGPIEEDIISSVFSNVCGYSPKSDSRALTMLQRLPGLSTSGSNEGGLRYFVDENFVQVSASCQVYKFILNPYDSERIDNPLQWIESLDKLGISSLHNLSIKKNLSSDQIFESLRIAQQNGWNAMCADIALLVNELDLEYNRNPIFINDVIMPKLDLKSSTLNQVTFNEVIIKRMFVEIDTNNESIPVFNKSYILEIFGIDNERQLPSDKFIECIYEKFDEIKDTTSSILQRIDLSVPEKVALTILRKLHIQAGGGRQEKSLKKGMPNNHVVFVDQILPFLERENLVIKSKGNSSNRIWMPVRSKLPLVKELVKTKNRQTDILVKIRDIFNKP